MSEIKEKPCPLRQQAITCPDAPALSMGPHQWSYAAWDRAVAHYEQALDESGLRRGDRMLLSARASVEYCTLLLALFRKGIIACPTNPALPSKALKTWASFLRASAIYRDAPDNTATAPPSFQPPILSGSDEKSLPAPLPITVSTGAAVIQTSGSTGQAKAALLSLNNFLTAAALARQNMPLQAGDSWLLSLPLFHVSGLSILFRCIPAGATVVLPEQGDSLEDTLIKSQVTHLSLVPTQLQRLLDTTEGCPCLSTLKAVLLGGAPASTSLLRRAHEAQIPLITSYGMTETAAQCCAVPPGASLSVLQSSGRPLEKGSLRIDDDNRIFYRGEALFQGYLQEDGSLFRPLTEEGWFPTGDCGYFDDDGYLHITGRSDARFICGGENIQPEEIEVLLNEIPGVSASVVVGVADPCYGTSPVAFIRMEEGYVLDETLLRRHLEAKQPPFKIPRKYYPWPDEIPSGIKINRSWFTAKGEQLAEG